VAIRVLSVGQCSGDDYRIARALQALPEIHIDSAATAEDAFALLRERSYDVVLVNRILNGDGSSGMDFIALAHAKNRHPFMLVSDYEDAQAQAVAHGAVQGFGKSDLSKAATLLRTLPLRPVVSDKSQ
jgi:DNA-binding NarL/FixJ family response regulator